MGSRLVELIDEIDLGLAQRLLGRRPEGVELHRLREERDRCWIRAALACFGQSASAADLSSALTGAPGRFVPGEPMHRLVRGMRAEIDRIDAAAEHGARPGLAELRVAAGSLGIEIGLDAACFEGCFGSARAGEHPLRDALSLLSKLTDILGSDAPAQVLIQLVVAQFLLAQGYPAPGLDEGDWADWQLPGGEICFVQSVGVGLEFCP